MTEIADVSRDFAVARDVQRMVQLRRYEVEYEIYGTAYWDGTERYFVASGNDASVADTVEDLMLKGLLPLRMQTYRERRLVPSGFDTEAEQQVRVNACIYLRDRFPERYWTDLQEVIDRPRNNEGASLIKPIAEKVEGIFNDDVLQMFELLLKRLYLRRNLTEETYREYSNWLQEEREEMSEEAFVKDVFFKDMRGFAYGDGTRIDYSINALQKTIESWFWSAWNRGEIVSPIFKKRCWYNYEKTLADARSEFRETLKTLFNADYFEILEKIEELPVAIDVEGFESIRNSFKEDEKHLIEEWDCQGRIWGVKDNGHRA